MSATPILITVPKYVAITPNPLSRNSTGPTIVTMKDKDMGPASPNGSFISDNSENGRGKKRRLDHLTWEEKILRKKLKNRVAAQTSRDRKKAKMDDMERTIHNLSQQTEILQNKCDSLQSINESLLEKNRKLDLQVENLQNELEELKRLRRLEEEERKSKELLCNLSTVDSGCAGSNSNIFNRSAVSNTIPLPQELKELKSAQYGKTSKDSTASLWKIVALCLLYKTFLKTSMPQNSKNLQKVCSQISQETWKTALQQAALMLPKVQAARSDCLDDWWGPQQNSWNPAKITVTA